MWLIFVPIVGFVCLIVVALKYDSIVPPVAKALQKANSKIDRAIFRDDVVRLPVWIKLFVIFMMYIIALSISDFPKKFKAVKEFNLGKQYEFASDHFHATEAYLMSLKEYPDSDKLNARIFVNYYKDGDIHNALVTLKKLEGRELPSDVYKELSPIVQSIKALLQKEN
jgi:hypothetical protein